jgi:hypothetical protein
MGEPCSEPFSLLTGKNTGKIRLSERQFYALLRRNAESKPISGLHPHR